MLAAFDRGLRVVVDWLHARVGKVKQPGWFRAGLFVAALIPLLVAFGALGSDLVVGTRWFGSNPIKEAEHFLGEWTLRLLMFTVAITPLRRLTGWNWLAKHRRTLGLFAFAYVAAHFLVWGLLDVQLDWPELVKDLTKRPYIVIGFIAFLMMTALAVTSTQNAIRTMKQRWNKLHRLVYVIVALGLVHFLMAVKRDIEDPLIFAAVFAGIFLLRWRLTRPEWSAVRTTA